MMPLRVSPLRQISSGDTSNSYAMMLGNHVGTHVDAQRHFYGEGRAISDFRPEELVFKRGVIIDVPKGPGELITRRDLEAHEQAISRSGLVMIRTGIERMAVSDPVKFANDGPCISEEGAKYLIKFYPRLRCVGTDAISIGSPRHRDEGWRSHRVLLSAPDLLIIEDMALAGKDNYYDLVIVAPLLIEGVDSTPCTVIGICELY